MSSRHLIRRESELLTAAKRLHPVGLALEREVDVPRPHDHRRRRSRRGRRQRRSNGECCLKDPVVVGRQALVRGGPDEDDAATEAVDPLLAGLLEQPVVRLLGESTDRARMNRR